MTRYYYAGGHRIDLEVDDDLVAVDEQVAEAGGVGGAPEGAAARRLPGGVVVTRRTAIAAPRLAALEQAGAIRPVYRHERALMVALPEIRVEVDTPRQRKAALAAIATAPFDVDIDDAQADRIVVRPRSGRSDEALAVANHVYERAHPAASSVRFVQVVPRPGSTR